MPLQVPLGFREAVGGLAGSVERDRLRIPGDVDHEHGRRTRVRDPPQPAIELRTVRVRALLGREGERRFLDGELDGREAHVGAEPEGVVGEHTADHENAHDRSRRGPHPASPTP